MRENYPNRAWPPVQLPGRANFFCKIRPLTLLHSTLEVRPLFLFLEVDLYVMEFDVLNAF